MNISQMYLFNTVRPGNGYLTILSWNEIDIHKNQNSMETFENFAALESEEDYQVPSYEVPEGESNKSLEYEVYYKMESSLKMGK